jgi:asparagine synthase (glutamine-hydrolysing)
LLLWKEKIVAGVAGILRLDGAPLDASLDPILQAMGRAIAHRGLTDRHVIRRGPLGLVLPSTEGLGSTELVAFDGRGEPDLWPLYQHQEAAFIERLQGPFALAIWDEQAKRLLLARDRLGTRPLFHARVGQTLLFGSEVKALLAHPDCPREIDWLAALAYEAMPRRSHPRTSFVQGIESLAPGTLLLADVRRATVEPRRWYTRPVPTADELASDSRSDTEIIEGYRSELERAVDAALGNEADRTGLLLSGGIDSMSIAALAARRARLPVFTVLGQSTFGNGDAGLAHCAATELELPEHQVLFRVEQRIAPDEWRRLLWSTETPYCAYQHYYKFHLHRYAREAYPGLRRMLNGEGSDEFAGADFRNHGGDDDGGNFDDYISDLTTKQREQWHSVETLGVETWMGRTVFSRDFLARSSGRPQPRSTWERRAEYCLSSFEADVLWRDDRLAASLGLAAEAPFLDHRLLDYVTRIPPRAQPALFWRKRMLREAMVGIVPESLRNTPKIPFFGGVDSRFTARLIYNALMADDGALVREALGDGNHPVLAPGLLDDILADMARDPQRGAVGPLLLLTNLGLLERMARDAAARPGPAVGIPALTSLGEWDEARIAARLSPPRREIHLDAPLAFAPNVYLVRPDAIAAEPVSYVVVNDEVKFVLDGDDTKSWREVLRRVDGKRTLRAILDELGLTLGDIRKHLDEALDFEVLAEPGT